MCGIAGALVFGGSGFAVTEPYIAGMRDLMAHRGPDGAGSWVSPDGRIGLGHRRLSIIDLSEAAAQPMGNEDGSIRIVFNGELYNHASIRKELETGRNHRFRTDHSDTEVILHAFEEWGFDCLHRFRGMFAIALWDGRSRELWLVRDRIGIKPLYYSVHDGRVVFASEIKALLRDPDQRRIVDEESLFHYLSFLAVPAPRTLFEGIRKVPPGTWIRFREDGDAREERYWDVWDHVRPLTGIPEEEIARQVLAELRTSVRLRKESDVPVGVFLSGGIDSSTNAALFSEGEHTPVKTFTIGYEGEYGSYKNELHYARRMAREVGAEHHELLLTVDDLIDFLPHMVRLQDEPIADPVCVPVYCLVNDDLAVKIAAFLKRHHNARDVRIDNLQLLTGGASRQTWSFDAAIEHTGSQSETLPLILRADPRRSDLMTKGIEYALHESVAQHGVVAPRMHANGDDSIGLPFFIMERIDGETIARRLLRDEEYANTREVLPGQLAAILAKIHAVPIDAPGVGDLPAPAEGVPPALHEIGRHEQIYRMVTPDPHPAFELAFRWLREHAPGVTEQRLVHGDYRIGNVIFGPEGARSILDWELAHIGDPMEDIGWLCVRSWRFGGDKPVGGVGERQAFYAAYEAAGGAQVNPGRVRYWETFGNLRWGITCIVQVKMYLSGASSSVELASIGRRVAETEWELLRLMEA